MVKGFNKTEFMSYLEKNFSGFENSFLRETVENLVDYGLEHQNVSLDQFCYWLSDLLPEVVFNEVAAFMDDDRLTTASKAVKQLYLFNQSEPKTYFTVRDVFGDDVGEKFYPSFEIASKKFKECCDASNVVEDINVDGLMLGMVFQTAEKTHKCVLLQNVVTEYGENILKPMHDNISWDSLVVPEIELAALKAKQLVYCFDQQIQGRIDELEKKLGVYERGDDTSGDLFVGKWRVHLVPTGKHYGLDNRMINEKELTLVEFYDCSTDKDSFPNGQFVNRYSVYGLLDERSASSPFYLMQYGLCLNGECPKEWTVSGDEMRSVYNWLKNQSLKECDVPKPSLNQYIGAAKDKNKEAAAVSRPSQKKEDLTK